MSSFAIAVTGIGTITRTALRAWDGVDERDEPPDRARPLDGFDPVVHLGKRGWRILPPATRYGMAAARLAAADAFGSVEEAPSGPAVGVSIGTNFAVDALVERFDRAVVSEGVRGLSPMEAPQFSINLAASQIAIMQQLTAFSLTFCTLIVAGFEALAAAREALFEGRAEHVLAGAVEGKPPLAADDVLGPRTDAGGACVLWIEPLEGALERRAVVHAVITDVVRGSMRIDGMPAAPAALRRLGTGLNPARDAHLMRGRCSNAVAEAVGAALGSVPTRWHPDAPQSSVTPLLDIVRLATGPGGPASGAVTTALSPQGQYIAVRVECHHDPTTPRAQAPIQRST